MNKKWQNQVLILVLVIGFCLTQTLPVSALGHVWGTPVDVVYNGEYTSLAVVDGYPAISYYDNSFHELKYIRATDANGTTWGSDITLDSSGYVGSFNSLAIVNGNPAVSYFDNSNVSLKYIRATDTTGATWGSPITVESGGVLGEHTSLTVVSGYPAISYYDMFNKAVKYVRATNAEGTSWGTPVIVDSAGADDVGEYTTLLIVNGRPAISYFDRTSSALKFIRAEDTTGATWGTPVTVDNAGFVGEYASATIVNGVPAISYYDRTNSALKYVQAGDINGTSWGTPVTVDNTGSVGEDPSMAVIDGRPSISYYDSSTGSLKYVSATDADGATWGASTVVDTFGNSGRDSSLAMVNGQPAIGYSLVYSSFPDVRYVRASGVVDISVWDGAAEIENNIGSLNFGSTMIGIPLSITITIQNTGTQPLDLETPTFPAGFSLVGTFGDPIPPGGSTTMELQLDATSAGNFSGDFQLMNSDAENKPFIITLTGTVSLLDEPVFTPATNPIDFGLTMVGTPVTTSITIENPNPVPMSLSVSSMPPGFSLVDTLADPIPANSSTTMTLQLDADTVGSFSDTLVLESADAENSPYNFTLNGIVEAVPVNGAASSLPETGFRPGAITQLPPQSVDQQYATANDLLLEIPSLGVHESIVGIPQIKGKWDVKWLGSDIGWLNGTAFPTWNGNTVLAGHNVNANGRLGPFAELDTLSWGDEIIIHAFGIEHVYLVQSVDYQVNPRAISDVLQHEEVDWLTLITCTGYNPVTDSYDYRVVVRAVLVGAEFNQVSENLLISDRILKKFNQHEHHLLKNDH